MRDLPWHARRWPGCCRCRPLARSAAQTGAVRPPKAYNCLATADGHPDLQGCTIWPPSPASSGPMGVPAAYEQGRGAEAGNGGGKASGSREARPIDGDRTAPPKGGDGSVGAAGNVGGYNTFWLDPGSVYTIVDGQDARRSSIDPPDGRVPPMTPLRGNERWRRLSARDPPQTPRRATTPDSRKLPAPTTIPSAVRSASAVCWVSVRPRDRRRCRTTSITISTRSSRHRTR